jgi:polyphenol oxidase
VNHQRGAVHYGFEIQTKASSRPLVRQVHGKRVWEFDSRPEMIPEADAIVTFENQKEIYIYTADCLPVLLFGDASDAPVAAVHCGWRGAKQGIVRDAARKVSGDRSAIHAVLGPCLGPCCFEVKDDFVREFEKDRGSIEAFLERRVDRMFFDLPRFVAEIELRQMSVLIHRDDLKCTFCSQPSLPSYRRNRRTDPHLRAWIVRKNS